MKPSTKSFNFPDVNVWLALSYERHEHHLAVRAWFDSLSDSDSICFSRFTQLGLLRLLTTEAIMGRNVMSQKQAWDIYDAWINDDRVLLVEEAAGLEAIFRRLSQSPQPSSKSRADAYLAAFASAAAMNLVTFDRGFRGKLHDLVLLPASRN
jgi:toxin-antitoxin system PIN domain toxin